MRLEVERLSTGYGRVPVVRDVGFTIEPGRLTAILGHNGAGKTTLLRAIVGVLPAREGSIRFSGTEVSRLRPHLRVRRGLAYVPQGQQAFGQLTAAENLRLVADYYGAAGRRRVADALDLFPALRELLARPAGLLSGGQRQQLAIARALVTDPELLVLDEPTEGIQPSVVTEIQEAIATLTRARELSVLLVEQHVGFAVAAADEFLVLTSGRLSHRGPGGPGAAAEAHRVLAL